MSNLGLYQTITTAAKKVGGPKNLIALTLAGGYGIGKACEVGIKTVIKQVKQKRTGKSVDVTAKVYEVTRDGGNGKDLKLCIGDKYRILESDGDSVLIERLGDRNNPYFISADVLREISDFT